MFPAGFIVSLLVLQSGLIAGLPLGFVLLVWLSREDAWGGG